MQEIHYYEQLRHYWVLGLMKYPRQRNKPCCNTHQQKLIVITRIYFQLLFLFQIENT